jgi:ribosomal protein S18 acetylase RimI-like enzyme
MGATPAAVMLRRASSRDVATLSRLWIDLTEHHAREDALYAVRPNAQAEIERLLRAELHHPDTAIWLAQEDAEALGFCSARIDGAPPIHDEVERAQITDLWVAPDSRRTGVGGQLVEAALRWIEGRGVARVEVRVATRNPEGQAFWRALGFGDFMDVLHRRL